MDEKEVNKIARVHKDKLFYGEVYETEETSSWSEYIERKNEEGTVIKAYNGDVVEVPQHSRLMFRSFAPYLHKKNPNEELALFYWMEAKKTVCLICSPRLCWFHIKHIPWEYRHISSKPQVSMA
jgi:hypothetical protein